MRGKGGGTGWGGPGIGDRVKWLADVIKRHGHDGR